ncbi:MAG: methyltransferase domain-containing protein [Cyanobacteriota/Melainabacteria group bacterium]
MTGPEQTPTFDIDRPEFWELCYQQGRTPWEYGRHAPPLETFMKSPYRLPPGKVAVLGCGTGHDAVYLAQMGYEVTGIDFAPTAIQSTYQKFVQARVAGKSAFLLQRDIFDLHEYTGYFDSIVEHTCFCSIDPVHRRRYMFATRDLLKKGGKFLAIWWIGERHGEGLPFSVSRDEIFELYDGVFSFDIVYEPQDSFPQDQGKELLTLMTRL